METQSWRNRWMAALMSIVLLLLATAACSPSPASPTVTATPPASTSISPSTLTPSLSSTATAPPTSSVTSGGQSVTIDLTAQNLAFDKSTISVAAGANVTVNFNNKDSGMPHNFSVYQTLAGGQTKPIFIGNTVTGPANATYHFVAPTEAGTYFFECDVHPSVMNGTFIITGQ